MRDRLLILGLTAALVCAAAGALAQGLPAADAPQAVSPVPAAAAPAPASTPDSATAQAAAPPSAPVAAPSAALPHDLSPWGMFMAADVVVKAVMVGLAFASVVTWTIWLVKALELFRARRRAVFATRLLREAADLASAAAMVAAHRTRRGAVADLVRAAMVEDTRSADLPAEGTKERVAIALSRVEARAGREAARGTGLLATIGSTAPFVGLFGTVWGIMNSFIGISQAKTTNLAVVAPGIAEALLATAIGLVAAIPAVIVYNVFARSVAGYRALLSDASAEVLSHVSRDIDRRTLARGASLPVALRAVAGGQVQGPH